MKLLVDGGELYYEVYGEGETIVFLNGFASGISNWYPVIKDLKQSYRCVLFDYLGTGDSQCHTDYQFSLDAYANDINQLIESLDAEKVHLVGYSMGGWLAQYYSRQFSEKVVSLSLINSSSRIFARQNWIISHFIDVLRDSDIEVFGKLMFVSYYSPEFFEKNEAHLDRLKKLAVLTFEKQSRKNWESVLHSCLPFNGESHLSTLDIPVLCISGETDVLCPKHTAERFKQLVKNITAIEFPSVGHAIPMEQFKLLKIELERFITNLN
ncbi:alpha/beta fold hydrolase [Aliikangiella maris]|uniref:Alpha/beta hydrolase n=2 Tax=Aliikangiella maris TaxID=3162458 RepID=A0ABV3MPT1_9GAMM